MGLHSRIAEFFGGLNFVTRRYEVAPPALSSRHIRQHAPQPALRAQPRFGQLSDFAKVLNLVSQTCKLTCKFAGDFGGLVALCDVLLRIACNASAADGDSSSIHAQQPIYTLRA